MLRSAFSGTLAPARGDRPTYRIVLAGYYEEHESLLDNGWRVERWKAQGGYAHMGDKQGKVNRHREALFYSPHCIVTEPTLYIQRGYRKFP
jgi:hypothetical protein